MTGTRGLAGSLPLDDGLPGKQFERRMVENDYFWSN